MLGDLSKKFLNGFWGVISSFFWNKDPDLTKVMDGKTLSITARVKGHELSKYTNCTETMLNYMKIEEIKG